MATEKRLIDANTLLKVLKHRVKGNEDSGIVLGTNSALEIMEEWVRSIPTVDAVEVVRCKDCKHTENMLPINNGNGHLMGDCTLRKEDDIVVLVWGDDFCSYGERRSDHG